MIYFASENFDGVHPRIMEALVRSHSGFTPSYGKDPYSFHCTQLLREFFGSPELEACYCFNGTGANNFALSVLASPHGAILCADCSHIFNAESTAPEAITGCRLYPITSREGKIQLSDLQAATAIHNGVHRPPPVALTLSQPTELGTVYSLQELETISAHCRQHNIFLHLDGARLFNALESLGCSPPDLLRAAQPEALSLGGTKSGLMFGEAAVFFRPGRWRHLGFNHKRSMQLASKNRFITVQFTELLASGLWKEIAAHTNALAAACAKGLVEAGCPGPCYPVQTNMVLLSMETLHYETLQSEACFYRWDEALQEVRLAFSYSNNLAEVTDFIHKYRDCFL